MTLSNGTVAASAASTNGAAAKQHSLPSHFIGGNRLDAAVPGAVKDFVAKSDGHSVITSVGFGPRKRWRRHWMRLLTGLYLLGSDRKQRYRCRQGN